MKEHMIKWFIFCLMTAVVPALYFMFVVGGFLPLTAIVLLSFTGTWGFKLFNIIHLLVYGSLFYFLARALARRIAKQSSRSQVFFLAAFTALAITAASLPIYGIGHHAFERVHLFALFEGDYF